MLNNFHKISLFLLLFFSIPNYISPHTVKENSYLENYNLTFSKIVKQTSPSVVNIYTSKLIKERRPNLFNDPFFQRFFGGGIDDLLGLPRERIQNSLGSGVIVKDGGIVVTNNHVIDGADKIKVVLSDRREFDASIVGTDKRTDLAVLKIINPPVDLPSLKLDKFNKVDVGDFVLAIGNPFGVGQTVTSGIVSALARSNVGVSDFRSFIQTDAAINPGNSGGALVSLSGILVGINTAIFSQDGGNVGIGFAIPTSMVSVVVESIIKNGKAVRGWFGAETQTITAEIADALGLEKPIGVIVNKVYKRSPANKAMIRQGDLIIGVNENSVLDSNNLKYLLATIEIGEETMLRVVRGDVEINLFITLLPPPEIPKRNTREIKPSVPPFGGATVANINPALVEELGIGFEEGVIILNVLRRSFARQVGLIPGDLIVKVNGRNINKVSDLLDIISEPSSKWIFTFKRNGKLIQRSISL